VIYILVSCQIELSLYESRMGRGLLSNQCFRKTTHMLYDAGALETSDQGLSLLFRIVLNRRKVIGL